MNDCTCIPVNLKTFYKLFHVHAFKTTNILEKIVHPYLWTYKHFRKKNKSSFVPLAFSLEDTATDIYIFLQSACDEGTAEVVLISSKVTRDLSMNANLCNICDIT
jgi:hypothetical protein